jgi:hypothetical protein
MASTRTSKANKRAKKAAKAKAAAEAAAAETEDDDSDEEESNKEEIARLKKERADEQKENKLQMAKLHQDLLTSQASSKRHRQGNARDGEPKTSHEKAVAKTVKDKVFAHCKFINGDIGLAKWTKICGEMMGEYEGLSGKALIVAEQLWCDENSDLVRTGLNEARNYAQSQCRTKAQKLLGLGKYLPTPEEVLVCAMRGDVGKTDQTMGIFDLYVDELIFCILGKPNWDVRFRYHGCISTTYDPSWSGDVRRVSIGSEAFLVLMFENCYDKWQYMMEEKLAKRTPNKKHKRMQTPYTDALAGQNKYGGWNVAGKKRFKALGDMIHAAQAKEPGHVKMVEEACLARLRAKHNVGGKARKRAREEFEEEEEDGIVREWE